MNPGSKDGRSRKKFKRIFSELNYRKINFDYEITKSLSHASELSKMANTGAYDVVVAVGGDGTINAVINGFYNSAGRRLSNAKMGVIYTGTSPDFCKSYNVPIELEASIDTLLNMNSTKLQVGRIGLMKENLKQLNNQPFKSENTSTFRYFACCANIGLGAELARRANGGIRKVVGDFLGTFLSLIKTIYSYDANQFTLLINGDKLIVDDLYNLSIGRSKYIASGIKFANNCSTREKDFYCLIIRNLTCLKLPRLIKTIYGGKPIRNCADINLQYANNVEIYGNHKNSEIEFDGDPAGYLPCMIDMAKDHLELVNNPSGIN
jgi:diacylglycerol kinase family enzyme